jgi:hypothetical protein
MSVGMTLYGSAKNNMGYCNKKKLVYADHLSELGGRGDKAHRRQARCNDKRNRAY